MDQVTFRQDVPTTTPKAAFMARRERFSIAPIGEFYRDLLEIDSWINARTASTQANSLLCAKLQEREPKIRERVAYLARKRGISTEEMWVQILKGEAVDLLPDEFVGLEEGADN